MAIYKLSAEESAETFWEGMCELSAAGARHRDPVLYDALLKVARAAISQGVPVVAHCGLFVPCPVCHAVPGQTCIAVPQHPVPDGGQLHPERAEAGARVIAGDAAPP